MEPVADTYGITAEWLTDALREGGHLPRGRVREVDVGDIGVGRGYISQSVRVTPTYEGANGDAPASFVAKGGLRPRGGRRSTRRRRRG